MDHHIVSSDSNSSTIKYGDSDLSSKRRKMQLHKQQHTTIADDYSNFSKSVLDDDGFAHNSTFSDDILLNSFNSNCDFKGGLLTNTNFSGRNMPNQSLTLNDSKLYLRNCDKSAEKRSFITRSPSGTSCGFENTFSILENQLKINKEKQQSSCDVTVIDRINKLNNDADEYHPSFFELELEAMQRAKEILEKYSNCQKLSQLSSARLNIISNSNCQNQEVDLDNTITAPIGELLDDIPSIIDKNNSIISDASGIDGCGESSFKLFSSDDQQKVEDYSQYVYHIAKGKDGRKYLKIVRSLLLDKVLCGNRVSQMTRAYNDIKAVTRLLEEKEKDLELTVQIGKELLTQNNRLESRITDLETELKLSNEDRSQLLHDLHQKNELIAVLTNYADDSSENETPTLSKSITLDLLQKKIVSLQDENKSLKMETSQLVKKTDEVEEQERKLMADITIQLNSTNNEFDNLNLELERQKEENRLQHEQIVNLTTRLTEAEIRLHQLTTENDEQISLLSITKENQNLLTTELAEFKVRYQEVLSLLQEAQEQLRNFRKKQTPHARSSFISGIPMPPQPDSLHSELMESSLYSENSLDSGICTDRLGSALSGRMSIVGIGNNGTIIGNNNSLNLPPYRKIFETVQCAGKNGNYSDGIMSQLGGMSSMALSSSTGPRMSTGLNNPAGSYHRPSSVYSGSYPSYDSASLGIKTLSCESLQSQSDDNCCYPTQPNGVPGAPGAKDLEAALKRLTPSEVLVRRAMLSHAPIGTYSYDEQNHQNKDILPFGIRTPDSIMSTGSSSRLSNMSSALSSTDRNQWRLPEKLQIVKPMEGSQTLHHWSRLATPTLSGLLEDRPGVKIRGGRGLEDLGLQIYSLSDVEEDVDDLPGKQYQAACVYTYTTSHVMHPDDGLTSDLSFLSQSQLSSRMASTSTSRQPSCPPTPRGGLSRRNSCSTFSVNMGLASMLNERGIKAVTPSALNTPAGPNFTPTVTPYNSPEGSPTRSMSPEPLFGILSTGADMIRRKLIGEYNRPIPQQRNNTPHNKQQKIMLSRLEKRALRSLRLLEKVECIGLENIISTQPNAMSQLVSGIASRSASPMAQLTSLKNLQQTPNNNYVDDMHFDRNQIRSVLSKGLSNDSLKSGSSIYGGDNDFINSFNSDDSCSSELYGINYGNSCSSDTQLPPLKPSSKFYNTSIANNESSFPKLKNHNNQNDDQMFTTTASSSTNNVPSTSSETTTTTTNNETSDLRLKQIQRQKSRRNLKNGQRPDLGTVGNGSNGRVRSDLGKVDQNSHQNNQNNYREDRSDAIAMVEAPEPTQSLTQSFVGSISSIFFGRKGGWL